MTKGKEKIDKILIIGPVAEDMSHYKEIIKEALREKRVCRQYYVLSVFSTQRNIDAIQFLENLAFILITNGLKEHVITQIRRNSKVEAFLPEKIADLIKAVK